MFENINISKNNITLMSPDRNPTLKIKLLNGIDCIKFKSSAEEYDRLTNTKGCFIANLIGRCEKNEWNGNIKPQFIITDYEILGERKFYL
jgi:hypothetical protein